MIMKMTMTRIIKTIKTMIMKMTSHPQSMAERNPLAQPVPSGQKGCKQKFEWSVKADIYHLCACSVFMTIVIMTMTKVTCSKESPTMVQRRGFPFLTLKEHHHNHHHCQQCHLMFITPPPPSSHHNTSSHPGSIKVRKVKYTAVR